MARARNLDPQDYDPSVAADHTGMMFKAIGHRERDVRRELSMFKKPVALRCPTCGEADRFIGLVDSVEDSNLAMIGCRKCGCWMKPFQMQMPQMTDERAKSMGLWVPGNQAPLVPVDLEVEL